MVDHDAQLRDAFSLRGASICELHGGKIKRNSDYWDMVTILKQILKQIGLMG